MNILKRSKHKVQNQINSHIPILKCWMYALWVRCSYSKFKKLRQFKRTVARSHHNARCASRTRRTRQVNSPRVRRAFVENFSDAPRAQDNLSKLLTALFAIAALQNLYTFLVRVPALGAAMVESAVSRLTRAR